MFENLRRLCRALLVFTVCVTAVGQQTTAMLLGTGELEVNGSRLPHPSAAIVPGTTIATGATSGAAISIPGAKPATIHLGVNTSVVYLQNSVQLNSGSATVTSSTGTSAQFQGLTVTGLGPSECRAATTPVNHIAALTGSCNVTDGKQTIALNEGQALISHPDAAPQTGTPAPGSGKGAKPAAHHGMSGKWVMVGAATVAAGGAAAGVLLTRESKPASPSKP